MIKFIDHKEVFEQLFRENYVRLYYHALSFLNDEETAKDTVNDVFEKVWMILKRSNDPNLFYRYCILWYVIIA